MSHLFYYLRGALGKRSLVKEHEEVLSRLLSGDYQSGNLEKLKGHDVYSFRLNKSGRLLFTVVTIDGEKRLLVLDYLPTHDYHKSKFLHSRVLRHYLDKLVLKDSDVDDDLDFFSLDPDVGSQLLPRVAQETLSEPPNGIAVDYFQNKVIQLSGEQEGALSLKLPSAIRGGAGSGKTAVALSIISSSFDADLSEDEPVQRRILYVAQSSRLVEAVRSAWDKLPQALDARHQVLFKTYDDLIKGRPGGADAILVGESVFNDWYKQFCLNEKQSAKAQKRAYEEPFPASKVYQECRLCFGYKQEEYAQLGQKQSLVSKDKRGWLYALYTSYQAHLKNQNFVDPAFHYFVEREQEVYDLVLVDEGQDLGLGQLLALSRLAKKRQFVVCMDDNQRLNDELSMFNRGCELLAIPKEHRVTLQASYRCPPQVMAVARQIIKFRELLAQGILDKHHVVEANIKDKTSQMGAVYMLDEAVLAKLSWLEDAAQGVDFAIVTSAEHVEEAKKRFNTPLVFTPERIKGLEYRVVIAWRLYSPDIFTDMSRRMRELGPEARQPTHQAKSGLGDSSFNPHLHALYTAYTRATEMLIISEPQTRETRLLLDKIHPFTEKGLPSADEAQVTRGSDEAWLLEVRRQIDSGNEDLAREIYVAQKLGTPERFNALIPSRRPQQQASVRMTPEEDDWKMAPTSAQQAIKVEPFSEHKERALPSGRELPSSLGAVASSLPQPSLIVISREQLEAQKLSVNFSAKRLGVLLALANFDIEKLLLSEVFDGVQHSRLLNFILQNEERLAIFFKSIVNDLDVLMKMPFQLLLSKSSQHIEAQKKFANLNKLMLDFCAIAKSSVAQKNVPLIFNLLSKYIKPGSTNVNTQRITPTIVAAATNNIHGLNLLKKLGADINQADKDGNSPVHIMTILGNVGVLSILKKLGANLDARNAAGSTPAYIAAQQGKIHSLRILKELNASMDIPNNVGCTPVFAAVLKCRVEVLRELYELNADLNVRNFDGATPAYLAAQEGFVPVLRALKELDADLNTPNKDGFTLACIAAQLGHVEVLRALKDMGVNLKTPNNEGFTPAHLAAQNGHSDVLEVLIELGVNLLDTPNKQGSTPAHLAAKRGSVMVLQTLKKLGADLDFRCKSCATPAYIAAEEGNAWALQFLIDSGCSLDTWIPQFTNAAKNFALNQVAGIQERMNAHIEKQMSASSENLDVISISIADIAYIMGHQDCVTHIKEALIERQKVRLGPPSFFARSPAVGIDDETKGSQPQNP